MKLNCVSSFKPFHVCSEYAQLQVDALRSWIPHYDRIIYLNDPPEPQLAAHNVEFWPEEDFPRIKRIAQVCAELPGITVWSLADLVCGPKYRDVIIECVQRGFACGTTCRYNFDKKTKDLSKAEFHPGGYDLFYGLPEIWKVVAEEIPEVFRIGNPIADSWFLQFFGTRFADTYCNFHSRRVVFHPLGTAIGTDPQNYCDEIGKWYGANVNSPMMTAPTRVTFV